MAKEIERLFVVIADGAGSLGEAGGSPGNYALGENMVLVRTSQTQSQLYHAVKRRLAPDRLFVARLDGPPKFKGMADGSLTWVREASAKLETAQ